MQLLLMALALAAPGSTDLTGYASAADVKAQVEAMRRAMKPGQGFLWNPLVRGGDAVVFSQDHHCSVVAKFLGETGRAFDVREQDCPEGAVGNRLGG